MRVPVQPPYDRRTRARGYDVLWNLTEVPVKQVALLLLQDDPSAYEAGQLLIGEVGRVSLSYAVDRTRSPRTSSLPNTL